MDPREPHHPDALLVADAEDLLGCPRGARRREVQGAYRRTLMRGRPDLGLADADWTARVQAARDVLLSCAAPERRGPHRPDDGRVLAPARLRRASWGLAPGADAHVDVRL